MNPIIWNLILKLATSKYAKRIVIAILAVLARRTDNTVDDEFVAATAGALEIRVPEFGMPDVPADNNIFLGNAELTQIKDERPAIVDPHKYHEQV